MSSGLPLRPWMKATRCEPGIIGARGGAGPPLSGDGGALPRSGTGMRSTDGGASCGSTGSAGTSIPGGPSMGGRSTAGAWPPLRGLAAPPAGPGRLRPAGPGRLRPGSPGRPVSACSGWPRCEARVHCRSRTGPLHPTRRPGSTGPDGSSGPPPPSDRPSAYSAGSAGPRGGMATVGLTEQRRGAGSPRRERHASGSRIRTDAGCPGWPAGLATGPLRLDQPSSGLRGRGRARDPGRRVPLLATCP